MKRVSAILLVLALTALLAPAALAKGRHGKGHGCGPGGRDPAGFVSHHAERLGLDEATLQSIDTVVAASREESGALRDQLHEAHERMRELLEADAPDEAAVMAQAETIGDLETLKHQARLRALLGIRALLTPEQREELDKIRAEGPFARFEATREACAEELAQLCPGAADRGPHGLFCLKDHRDELSDTCRTALDEMPKKDHRHHWKKDRAERGEAEEQ